MAYDERIEELKARPTKFSLRNLHLFWALPRSEEGRVYGRQLLRSSSSVGANHREACRARSKAEFIAKMGDCLKELDESEYWLELIEKAGLLPAEKMELLKQECGELIRIFVTVLRKSRD